MCCACVVGANGSQVRLGRSSDISVLNGIAPQMPLLIFYLLDSRIGHKFLKCTDYFLGKAHKSALARVHNLRNREMRMNPVIFTVSNPCIL